MTPPDPAQLYKEAASVGIALVPMWFAVTQFTTAVKWMYDNPYKGAFDVALAGALFHLTAEETGLNTWYLTNSYAHEKSFSSNYKKAHHDDPLLDSSMDWIRGAGSMFGL